ncbi:hypothetical protein NEPAR06_2360 [Nematocida parisii]|uniref:Ubiquitin-like domain-containing protein n=1 Tax=Nematocida parisii (strain ERTm3) TaxID=935791 RepID=I3EJT3_NEMP3|nr:uncharacterized protein NEPG_00992 [Nematocida parisii ERTm1]EIJ89480.1 hypothetical protein NEQG_00250 [Nematocida parisii ERTm3]KAI5131431.1 hypothetical protein NEPAR03_2434 [Nematocida parisii]EIJ94324.1 hypothetical protein NEPG_00992 [Nematocida parisii ERTm1]KAI5131447.1 hypothetical protein NEPAR08_2457 [Nematocida parisii]KAI5146111.1 hypothetical protein NEPAR04_2557 [Nematocida parisii]|eukprot:XP_013058820.1 hypothetical protein NEPG_00992 [Nematocida parisii ERTm1]
MHRIIIKHMQETVELDIDPSETVDNLKNKVGSKLSIEPYLLKLTHKGSILADPAKTMEALQIGNLSVVYAHKLEKSQGPSEINEEVYKQETLHSADKPGPMKNPAMKKLFSNPDIMKGLLEMLPELKNENPELRKLMESSEMLEQMSKIADDPEYMNTQMKNLDIAMAKLETIPGGFNMLRSMLKTQKDPSALLAEERDRTSFKEGTTDIQPSNQPVPNPWGKYNFNPILEYRKQVEYMKECGFTDVCSNIKLLIKHHGDVDNAISEILSGSSMHSPLPDNKSHT